MSAAIVSIGTELTRGELLNGNARYLGERLAALGFEVIEHVTVADDTARIVQTLDRLCRETQVVVCTGGLGPTSDDLTTAAVAQALNVPLERDQASLSAIEERYRALQRVMPEMTRKQADFPKGASVLPNAVGTAPGFAVTLHTARAFFMPGVPKEMTYLFETHVAPAIAPLAPRTTHQVHVRTSGLPESLVAERVADLEVSGAKHTPGITLGYRASVAEVEVKVLAQSSDAQSARELAERVGNEVRTRLADVAYGGKDDTFSAYVGELLKRAGLKVALAESCTGGLIMKMLTDIAGSSEYVLGGAVTYANSAKRKLLDVPADVLRAQGAVAEDVARAMAENVLAKAGADLSVAVTGIAGPGGGSEHKPVGTVCFALARKDGQTRACTRVFPGDREAVRIRTAHFALRLIADATQESLDAKNGGNVQRSHVP